jgi:hypothetical protein
MKTVRCVVFLGWMKVLCSVLIVCRIDFVIVGMLVVVPVVGGVVCSYPWMCLWGKNQDFFLVADTGMVSMCLFCPVEILWQEG